MKIYGTLIAKPLDTKVVTVQTDTDDYDGQEHVLLDLPAGRLKYVVIDAVGDQFATRLAFRLVNKTNNQTIHGAAPLQETEPYNELCMQLRPEIAVPTDSPVYNKLIMDSPDSWSPMAKDWTSSAGFILYYTLTTSLDNPESPLPTGMSATAWLETGSDDL